MRNVCNVNRDFGVGGNVTFMAESERCKSGTEWWCEGCEFVFGSSSNNTCGVIVKVKYTENFNN